MLIDLRDSAPQHLDADIAVIGAGAAGITLARRLVDGGRSVLLLESGGLDFEADTADMNAGESVGEPYYDLERSRLRFFGGTTAIWGGRSAALDPIDFERRPWVEHSGWPFGADELHPWYDRARALLGLDGLNGYAPHFDGPVGKLDGDDVALRHWAFDMEFDRFGAARNADLIANPRLTAVLHATVREIVAAPSGGTIDRLDLRGPGGRLTVKARTYILAAGGLENPRLMLASNSVIPHGLGNGRDLVGRFFMEHPHARGGRLTSASAWTVLHTFRAREFAGARVAPLITPSPELQEREGILNSALTVAARPPTGADHSILKKAYLHAKHSTPPTEQGRGLWKAHRRLNRRIKQIVGPLKPWLKCVTGRDELALVIRAEQCPNPDSRVTLSDQLDALGMPRIKLDWRLNCLDVDSAAGLVAAFARESERIGLGKVEAADWLEGGSKRWSFDDTVSAHPIGGFHHMGTTRMADDPRQGVTDGFGKVHGIDNLYVAGSSLFPTGGWANPTLTILALALRTADHILGNSKRARG